MAARYLKGGRLRRPAGIGLAAQALAAAGLIPELQQLCYEALVALTGAGLDYEARAYFAQAAWVAADALGESARLEATPGIEEMLCDSPIVTALATGQAIVEADGPPGELGQVSRLYLAAILDLAASYDRRRAEISRLAIEAKYQGTAGYRWLAFLGVTVPTVAIAGLLTWLAWPVVSLAFRLYLRQQFSGASGAEQVGSALVVIAWSYLLPVTGTVIDVAFRLLVRRNVASDAHLAGEVLRALRRRLAWWSGGVVAGVLAVGWNPTSSSVQAPMPPTTMRPELPTGP